MIKIALEDRFTDVELFKMFNIDIRCENSNGKMAKVPLWHTRKVKKPKQKKVKPVDGEPGSQERIAAYAEKIAAKIGLFEEYQE